MAAIGIITIMSVRMNPFMAMYRDALKDTQYDLICWDRNSYKEDDPQAERTYSYDYPLRTGYTKLDSLRGYFGFSRFVKRIIEANKYEKLILLQVQSGFIIKRFVHEHFAHKYILDVRDFSYENLPFYRRAEKRLVDESFRTVISSDGFKAFLPEHDYVLVHNSPASIPEDVERRPVADPIVITYIGFIHYIEQNKRLIDLFANDERFVFRFIGEGSDALQEYVEAIGATNIILHGAFKPIETSSFYESTDVISNAYGNGIPLLDYALSNKLYYSMIYRKPILVSPGTYTEKYAKSVGLGYTIDFSDENCKEGLIAYLTTLDYASIDKLCINELDRVKSDNEFFKQTIREFIK